MAKTPNIEAIQKRWYNENEACIYTGKCREYLRKARDKGKLAFREWKDSNRILYDKQDLDRFVESGTNLYKSVDQAMEDLFSKKKKKHTNAS